MAIRRSAQGCTILHKDTIWYDAVLSRVAILNPG